MIASTVEPVSQQTENAPTEIARYPRRPSHTPSNRFAAHLRKPDHGAAFQQPRRQSILIVDDEPIMHAIVSAMLSADNLDIYTSADSETAIELATRLQPDLVLLDVNMPIVNGLEICTRLKSEVITAQIPIMFISGSGTSSQRAAGLDLGAVDFVAKPFDPLELRARVRASLRNKAMIDLLATRCLIDGQTGLWNRSYFQERLQAELNRVKRGGPPLSIILMDIDHFKSINDQYGHTFGDHVLQQVAHTLSGHARLEDAACRFGGEEFAIIATGASLDGATIFAERLREAMQTIPLEFQNKPVTITASFGVAASAESVTMTIEQADRALYHAKREGRNRVIAAACIIP